MTSPIADTFGELLIGIIAASILYGITFVQTYLYYNDCEKDRWFTKLLVVSLFLLDTLHLVFIAHATYYYLVDCFGAPERLAGIVWSMYAQLIIYALTALQAQLFYCWRIAILRKTWIWSGIISMFSFVHVVFNMFFVHKMVLHGVWTAIPQFTWITDIALSNAVAADVMIAIVMCFTLRGQNSPFAGTRNILKSLIYFVAGTGIITTTISLVCVIYFAVSPTFISTMLYWITSKLYTNAFLIQLNSRSRMRTKLNHGALEFSNLSSTGGATTTATHVNSEFDPHHVRIDVETSSDHHRDIKPAITHVV